MLDESLNVVGFGEGVDIVIEFGDRDVFEE